MTNQNNNNKNIAGGRGNLQSVNAQQHPGRPGQTTKADQLEKEKLNAAAGGEFKRVKLSAQDQKAEPLSDEKLKAASGAELKRVKLSADGQKAQPIDSGKLAAATGGSATSASASKEVKAEKLDSKKLEKASGGFVLNQQKVETKVGEQKPGEKVDSKRFS